MTADGPKSLVLDGIRELSCGNEREALESFSLALAGSDGSGTAELCAARLLILRGRHDEAARALEGLLAGRPCCVEARVLLGAAHRGRNRLLEAIASYRAALVLDPANRGAAEALRELLDVQEP
jgi:tetratricopeptide (TPR) repeat protein